MVVELWEHSMVKMESIFNIPLCQLMDLSLVSVHPSQLSVNWMVLMITVINWVSRIIRCESKLVGQFIQLMHGYWWRGLLVVIGKYRVFM